MEREVSMGESTAHAIIDAVSTMEDVAPTALPPLENTVDSDALNALITPKGTKTPRINGEISFSFSNSEVTIQCEESANIHVHEQHT